MKERAGVTSIELPVVIAIIAILAAILLPAPAKGTPPVQYQVLELSFEAEKLGLRAMSVLASKRLQCV